MRAMLRRGSCESPELSSFINQVFGEPFFAAVPALVKPDTQSLAIDLSEDETSVLVRASLPGFAKEQVSVEVHDGVLTIQAEKSDEKEETTERFYRRERRFGSVSRSIPLPSPVREGEASAELKDGVLTVRVPRVEEKTPRKISIT